MIAITKLLLGMKREKEIRREGTEKEKSEVLARNKGLGYGLSLGYIPISGISGLEGLISWPYHLLCVSWLST